MYAVLSGGLRCHACDVTMSMAHGETRLCSKLLQALEVMSLCYVGKWGAGRGQGASLSRQRWKELPFTQLVSGFFWLALRRDPLQRRILNCPM
jgi:hypothetical protein